MLFDFLDFFGIAQVVLFLFFSISIVFALRDRHETSKFHQKAAAKEQDSSSLSVKGHLCFVIPLVRRIPSCASGDLHAVKDALVQQ